MKLIIANDIDYDLARKKDVRAYASRALWFANQEDVLIVGDDIDPVYVAHVSSVLERDLQSVNFIKSPAGRFDRTVMDPLSLCEPEFVEIVRNVLSGRDIDELWAMWPSSSVAKLVELLRRRSMLPGARFIGQGGGSLLNDKTIFRALSASLDFDVAPGMWVRSQDAAVSATRDLLKKRGVVLAKGAHGGAGARNEIIAWQRDKADFIDVGAKRVCLLDSLEDGVSTFWEDAWDRLSDHNRFGVVIESFIEGCKTSYAEFWCGDRTTKLGAVGDLIFKNNALEDEALPSQHLDFEQKALLERKAFPIADACRKLGYRGPLSVDAIIDKEGKVWFTEINCRFTGSTHLWSSIYPMLLSEDSSDVANNSETYLMQSTTNAQCSFSTLSNFLSRLDSLGILYQPGSNQGIIAITPIIGGNNSGGPLIYATVANSLAEHQALRAALLQEFSHNA